MEQGAPSSRQSRASADHPQPGPASTRVGRHAQPWPDAFVWSRTPTTAPKLIRRRANDRALGQMLAAEGVRLGHDRVSLRARVCAPAGSGNVNVNLLSIVAEANADGSRADRESCSQENTTAGGSSQLSCYRPVQCPCHGLHLLYVAESIQRYARVRSAPCSPVVRERWAHCHPFPTLPLCRAGATRGPAQAAAKSVPEYPLPVAPRATCGGLPAFLRWRLRGNEMAARRRPVPHVGCRASACTSSGPRQGRARQSRRLAAYSRSGRLCSTFQRLST